MSLKFHGNKILIPNPLSYSFDSVDTFVNDVTITFGEGVDKTLDPLLTGSLRDKVHWQFGGLTSFDKIKSKIR